MFTSCHLGDLADFRATSCPHVLPARWPPSFTVWAQNPVLTPSNATQLQGHDNVYAPEVHRVDGMYIMWYGGQGADGHDRIFIATSLGVEWRKYPSDQDPHPIVSNGKSNHVNDPTVARVADAFFMYYSEAPTQENDEIHLATSTDLVSWQLRGRVLAHGGNGSWSEVKVGRPSVLYEDGVFRMWFDGTSAEGRRSVGLATSADGVNFVEWEGNPVFFDAG
jgi:predicted GH43/DUF377 family glycosyl hydrolase